MPIHHRVLSISALLFAPLLVTTPTNTLAQQSYPYSCEWISEVTPNAVIRFSSTNGVGTYNGALLSRASA